LATYNAKFQNLVNQLTNLGTNFKAEQLIDLYLKGLETDHSNWISRQRQLIRQRDYIALQSPINTPPVYTVTYFINNLLEESRNKTSTIAKQAHTIATRARNNTKNSKNPVSQPSKPKDSKGKKSKKETSETDSGKTTTSGKETTKKETPSTKSTEKPENSGSGSKNQGNKAAFPTYINFDSVDYISDAKTDTETIGPIVATAQNHLVRRY
jgi:hypothetical protein